MNLDEVLNYKRPKETLYDVLGCHQSSSIDQINREYKIRALKLHPDKNTDADSLERFRAIQEAKDILTNEVSRKSYDTWLNSRLNVSFQQWCNRKIHSMHWASPKATKLSIQGDISSTGQGSDSTTNETRLDNKKNVNERFASSSPADPQGWLAKFRNYEI